MIADGIIIVKVKREWILSFGPNPPLVLSVFTTDSFGNFVTLLLFQLMLILGFFFLDGFGKSFHKKQSFFQLYSENWF